MKKYVVSLLALLLLLALQTPCALAHGFVRGGFASRGFVAGTGSRHFVSPRVIIINPGHARFVRGVVVARPFFPRVVVVRPFFPHVIVERPFVRVPFRFFPNRVLIQSPFFFGPSWYGSFYAPSYSPSTAPSPYDSYPPYDYAPVPPPPSPDTTYDRGYYEGYARGYEEAQKEIDRLLDLEKTPSDKHEKSDAEGNQ